MLDREREPMEPNRTGPDRSRPLSGGWGWALVALVPLTSLAAASVSAWLVPPYLILMAGLLLAPVRKARREARGAGAGGESPREHGQTSSQVERSDVAEGSAPETAAGSDGAAVAAATGTAVARPRKGRGKGKAKAKAEPGVAPEPVRVNWVRVGPGQFVRVEEAAPAEAGPHSGEAPPEGEVAGLGPGPETPAAPEDARDGEGGGLALFDRPGEGLGREPVGDESAEHAEAASSAEEVAEAAPEVLGWSDPGRAWEDEDDFVEPAPMGCEVDGGAGWAVEARGDDPRAEDVEPESPEAEDLGRSAVGSEEEWFDAEDEASREQPQGLRDAVESVEPGFTPGSDEVGGVVSIAGELGSGEGSEGFLDVEETGNAPSAEDGRIPCDFVPVSATPGPIDSPDADAPPASRPVPGPPAGRRSRRARRDRPVRGVRGIVAARNRPRRRATSPRRGARDSTPRAPPRGGNRRGREEGR